MIAISGHGENSAGDGHDARQEEGEKLANQIEHLFERQDQLLREAHDEHERLSSALRELATAMECERRARSEKPESRPPG